MKNITAVLLCVVLVLISAGCSQNQSGLSNEDGLATVRLVLDWTPNTNHTGIYVALEKGYYREAGIDLEIIQPPEEGALALLGSGKVQYAITFQEEIGPALAAANPMPVIAICTIIEHNTSGLISLRETGIESPKDLEGKRVATWGTPLVEAILRKIIENDGGSYDSMEMVATNVSDVVSALQTNLDVVWIYAAWDGIATQLAGLDTSYLDFGQLDPVFDFYTPIIATNSNYAQENGDQVSDFLKATERGYLFAIENPEEAADILLDHVPELDRELVLASQLFLADQYQADAARWGRIDAGRWSAFYIWMYEEGLLNRDLNEEGFTNEFFE